VSGEESALVHWLDGGESTPTFRVEKPTILRVGGRPTLVDNAETMANIGLIGRYGPVWFREVGAPTPRGRRCSPSRARSAVLVSTRSPSAHGSTASSPVRVADSGIAAVLLGGYGGAWLGPQHFSSPLTPSAMATAGASIGAGVVVALATSSCGLAETARIAHWMAGESAGQCGPCVFRAPRHRRGPDAARRRALLAQRARAPLPPPRRGGGPCACGHPDGVVRIVRSALSVSPTTSRHTCGPARSGEPCPHGPRPSREGRWPMAVTRRLRVDPVACDAFGHCAELAPELIALDEWGYPVIDERPIPPSSSDWRSGRTDLPPARAFRRRDRYGWRTTARPVHAGQGARPPLSSPATARGPWARCLGRREHAGRRSSPPWRSRPHVRLHVANRAELPQALVIAAFPMDRHGLDDRDAAGDAPERSTLVAARCAASLGPRRRRRALAPPPTAAESGVRRTQPLLRERLQGHEVAGGAHSEMTVAPAPLHEIDSPPTPAVADPAPAGSMWRRSPSVLWRSSSARSSGSGCSCTSRCSATRPSSASWPARSTTPLHHLLLGPAVRRRRAVPGGPGHPRATGSAG